MSEHIPPIPDTPSADLPSTESPMAKPQAMAGDDAGLLAFLQTYQPPVPELSSAQAEQLESRLWQQLAQTPQSRQSKPQHLKLPRFRQRWSIPALLGLAGLGLWGLGQWLTSPQPTAQQLAHLEQFLETSWENASSDNELWFIEP